MDSSYNEKLQALQVELERVQKENEPPRIMLEIVSRKFSSLQAEVQEKKAQQMMTNLTQNSDTFHGVYDTNKRARLEAPVIRPRQIIVRTDSKDKSLVSSC
uniref:Uncharacterized protein n=1 Tax=Rhizophora mucronata TaxID=61149 RepID=A0A2P2P409_RHIMU